MTTSYSDITVSTLTANDVEELRLLAPSVEGQKIDLLSYYSDVIGGGGSFVCVSSNTTDDGGMIFDSADPSLKWKRILFENMIYTNFFGLRQDDDGEENSQRLLKAIDAAAESNLTLCCLGEKLKPLVIDKTVKLTGKVSCMDELEAVEDSIILDLTANDNRINLEIDVRNQGIGGILFRGDSNVASVHVKNIYGAERYTYGIQSAVYDLGTYNNITMTAENIQQGDSGVDPVPTALTVGDSAVCGTYSVIMNDCQSGIIVLGKKCYFSKVVAKNVKDNCIYFLESSDSVVSSLQIENSHGEPIVNLGKSIINFMTIIESSGYGIGIQGTDSYLEINHLHLSNKSSTSVMPIVRTRSDHVNSTLIIHSLTGDVFLPDYYASIRNSLFCIDTGLVDSLLINHINLTIRANESSYKGMANFANTGEIKIGKTNINFIGGTAISSSAIFYMALPVSEQKSGSYIDYQYYQTDSAIIRMTNINNRTIKLAENQPVQVTAGPYITSDERVADYTRRMIVCELPVSGKYIIGDILILKTPTSTVKFGWRCTTAGEFGTSTEPEFTVIA